MSTHRREGGALAGRNRKGGGIWDEPAKEYLSGGRKWEWDSWCHARHRQRRETEGGWKKKPLDGYVSTWGNSSATGEAGHVVKALSAA